MPNLSNLSRHSRWTVFSSGIYIVLQAFQLVIITHYIDKISFGYLSISNAFCFLCVSLLETGVALSIVQSSQLKDNELKQLLLFNVKFAFLLSLGLIVISYGLKSFYGELAVQKIIFYMIPVIFLTAYNSIFVAKLKRELSFRFLSVLEILSFVLSFLVAVFLAIRGMEFMALVYAYWTRHIIIFLGLQFSTVTKMPKGTMGGSISPHLQFGKYVYGEKILTALIANADALIIGKLIGMNDLGAYDVFKKVMLRPILLFYNAIESVAFSLLSKLQEKPRAFTNFSLEFVNKINWISLLIAALIYVNAQNILLLFPESYASYEETLRLFAILISTIILLNPLDLILYAQGKTSVFLYWISAYSIPFIIVLLLGASKGLNILLLAYSVFNFIIYTVSYYWIISRETEIDPIQYLSKSLGPLLWIVGLLASVNFLFNLYEGVEPYKEMALSLLLILVLSSFLYRWFRKGLILEHQE